MKEIAGAPLIAVVKDDAYGHGAERVALSLHNVADAFAVATINEGAALRCAGVCEDILVLTPPLCKEEVLRISSYRMIASVTSFFVLKRIFEAAKEEDAPIRAHIAINTGMNRYGFRVDCLKSVLRKIDFAIEGVYSHLYAPASEKDVTAQARLFEEGVRTVKEFFPNAKSHLSATGGILAGVEADMVRAGISLYGYLPNGFVLPKLRSAMKIYASVAHNGRTIGHGFGYRCADDLPKRAHTLRLGYGDGFFRDGGNLCMDAWVRGGSAKTGERKLILKNFSQYAKEHAITEYEALASVSKRAEKEYDE